MNKKEILLLAFDGINYNIEEIESKIKELNEYKKKAIPSDKMKINILILELEDEKEDFLKKLNTISKKLFKI